MSMKSLWVRLVIYASMVGINILAWLIRPEPTPWRDAANWIVVGFGLGVAFCDSATQTIASKIKD